MNKKYFLSVIFTIATTYYSCEEKVPGLLGCTDQSASNYNELATIDDDSCVYGDISGCTDPAATNYNPAATNDDESCEYSNAPCSSEEILDCQNHCAPSNWVGNGFCDENIYNWPDGSGIMINFNCQTFNFDGGDCNDNSGGAPGCTDPDATNFNAFATIDDGSCEYDVYGCTDPAATNYNPDATIDDGSCVWYIFGCTDPGATNYNPNANLDDGSCEYDVYGCTDPNANNYNPNATIDNESCTYSLNCNSDFFDGDWILDCTGQGCANEAWLGDGWCDDNFSITNNADGSPFLQEDGSSPSGMSLSCYNNDGGDCPGFQDPNNPHQKMIDLSIIKY